MDTFAPPTPSDRRELPPPVAVTRAESAAAAAAWLATAGTALILVAVAVVVTTNWQDTAATVRFASLFGLCAAVFVLAERTRRSLPTSATVVAHLAPLLVPAGVIAAASIFSQPWPVCTALGGVVGLAVCEAQGVRWQARLLPLAAMASAVMAAVGVSGWSGVAVGPMVGSVGLALLAVDRYRATVPVVLAALAPLIGLVALQRWGAGTLTRLQLVGAGAWPAMLATAVLAATAIGWMAHRDRSVTLAATAAAVLASGALTAGSWGNWTLQTWVLATCASVIAVEVMASRRQSPFTTVGTAVSTWVSRPLVLASLPVSVMLEFFGAGNGTSAAFAGAALVVAVRAVHERVDMVADLLVVGFLVSVAVPLEGHPLSLALGSVALLGAAAFVAHRVILVWSTAVVVAIALHASQLLAAGVAVGALALIGTMAIVAYLRSPLQAWVSITAAATCATLTALTINAIVTPNVWRSGVIALALWSLLIARRSKEAGEVSVVVLTVSGFAAIGTLGTPSWWSVGAMATTTAAFVVVARIVPWAIHYGAASAVITIAVGVDATSMSATQQTLAFVIIGTALSGVAALLSELSPLHTAAATATVIGLVSGSSGQAHASMLSLVFALAGLQLILVGITRLHPPTAAATTAVGAATLVGSVVSLWWTAEIDEPVTRWLATFGAVPGDLVVATTSIAMAVGGATLRRSKQASSWVAYGGPVAVVAAWLTGRQLQSNELWLTIAALVIGIGLIAVGGVRRLASPLVGGTVLTVATVLAATRGQLDKVPTWGWLAVGGALLVGLAFMSEAAIGTRRSDISVLQAIRTRFQ